MVALFPFVEYWWFYFGFTGLVLLLLALDLGVFHRQAHEVSVREAAIWSVVWVALALGFNVLLYQYALWKFPQDPRLLAIPGFDPSAAAWRVSLEFLTGYIVEKALSIDNIFVFVLVFSYFAIPAKYQHRVLFYGIIGALICRAIFITLGSALMQYHWIMIIFGAFLLFTGVKMMFAPDKGVEPDKNLLIRLFRRFVPITSELHGQRFFIQSNGMLYATPLFVALLFLEATDVLFAVDSIPAIFAVTQEPFIVYSSNVFAILGLRALYFLLADVIHRFHYLKIGLSVVLVFVGLKMLVVDFYKVPIGASLAVIALVLGVSVVASWMWPRPAEERQLLATGDIAGPSR